MSRRHYPRWWWDYQASVLDAMAHGERDIISYDAYVVVRKKLERMKRTDPGGDIRL